MIQYLQKPRTTLLQKGTRIMKVITSAICYMGEREAIFPREEYSYAKHAHFQDKQKFRTGMSSQG